MNFMKLGSRYSFVYYDKALRKNVRLRKDQTPLITTEAEAIQFCREWQSKHDAQRTRIENIAKNVSKYHDFNQLFEIFKKDRLQEAPNTVECDTTYLRLYVFDFFLTRRKLNNPSLWPNYFEEFRDHLLEVDKVRNQDSQHLKLAYSTKNACIRVLNAFLSVLYRRNKVLELKKCRYFPKNKLNARNESSVISEPQQKIIIEKLNKFDPLAADMFFVALHTGLRMNELLGLSIADVFEGFVKDEFLTNALKSVELKPVGFLQIDSQPKGRRIGSQVPRKPLKGKKTIGAENIRTIPILETSVFNVLIRRFNEQQALFQKGTWGPNPKDYLLFDGLNKNNFSNALRKAQKGLDMNFTAHCARHTYSTMLAMKTGGNFALCRMILGHTSLDITLRYVHLASQLQKNLHVAQNLSQPMKMIKEQGSQNGLNAFFPTIGSLNEITKMGLESLRVIGCGDQIKRTPN
jgi:integrase